MNSLKSNAIKEYISHIDFKNDDWSIHQMEKDMKKILGETPAIDVSYKKDVMVNEISGESREIKKLNKIGIVFTDDDDQIKKYEIII